MLCQLSGQEEPDGGLDLPGGDGGPLVVVGQAGGLGGDLAEYISNQRVHDGHGLGGDLGVGVHLLQHLVDVNGVSLLPLLVSPPLDLAGLLGDLTGLLGYLGGLVCSRYAGESVMPGGHDGWLDLCNSTTTVQRFYNEDKTFFKGSFSVLQS